MKSHDRFDSRLQWSAAFAIGRSRSIAILAVFRGRVVDPWVDVEFSATGAITARTTKHQRSVGRVARRVTDGAACGADQGKQANTQQRKIQSIHC